MALIGFATNMIIKDFIDNELALSGAVNSSDICGALKLINAGRRLVYPLDDWTGTIEYGCVNLCDSCFYLPYHLETVRDIWQCCGPVPLGDEIWSSIGTGYLSSCCGDKVGVTRTDRVSPIPVQPPMGSIIGVRPLDAGDKDFTVRITIRNVAGSLATDEIKVKSFNEIVYGELIMGQIESIQKDRTHGPIVLYWRDNRGVNCKLYTLQADEVSPKYYMYKSTCQAGCAIIKAKKKFFPYTEKDIYGELDIQGVNGLMFAIKALEHQRSSQYDAYVAALKLARSHLERVKEDLKKTSEPAKAAVVNTSHPVSTHQYGSY
jgi:hypothetical protein